jgi:hypothetical protein
MNSRDREELWAEIADFDAIDWPPYTDCPAERAALLAKPLSRPQFKPAKSLPIDFIKALR